MRCRSRHVFASGESFAKAAVYYELADLAACHVALDERESDEPFRECFERALRAVATFSLRFPDDPDRSITQLARGMDWQTRRA